MPLIDDFFRRLGQNEEERRRRRAEKFLEDSDTLDPRDWEESFGDMSKWGTFMYAPGYGADLLDESNWEVISEDLKERFPNDIHIGSYGYRGEVIVVRVFDGEENITEAFDAVAEWKDALDNYPVADENHYSEKQNEAAWTATKDETEDVLNKYDVEVIDLDNTTSDVLNWLNNERPEELEDQDGTGAYPDRDAIKDALIDLGVLPENVDDEDEEKEEDPEEKQKKLDELREQRYIEKNQRQKYILEDLEEEEVTKQQELKDTARNMVENLDSEYEYTVIEAIRWLNEHKWITPFLRLMDSGSVNVKKTIIKELFASGNSNLLVKMLNDPDETVRLWATKALVIDGNTSLVAKMIHDESPKVREYAASKIKESGNQRDILKLLDSKYPDIRGVAIIYIQTNIYGTKEEDKIIKMMLNSKYFEVKEEALDVIKDRGFDPKVYEKFTKTDAKHFLTSDDPTVRFSAVQYAHKLGRDDLLTDMLDDPDEHVRAKVFDIIKSEIDVSLIIKKLKDDSPQIRRMAIMELQIKNEISPIINNLNDPDLETQKLAIKIIGRNGDKSLRSKLFKLENSPDPEIKDMVKQYTSDIPPFYKKIKF